MLALLVSIGLVACGGVESDYDDDYEYDGGNEIHIEEDDDDDVIYIEDDDDDDYEYERDDD